MTVCVNKQHNIFLLFESLTSFSTLNVYLCFHIELNIWFKCCFSVHCSVTLHASNADCRHHVLSVFLKFIREYDKDPHTLLSLSTSLAWYPLYMKWNLILVTDQPANVQHATCWWPLLLLTIVHARAHTHRVTNVLQTPALTKLSPHFWASYRTYCSFQLVRTEVAKRKSLEHITQVTNLRLARVWVPALPTSLTVSCLPTVSTLESHCACSEHCGVVITISYF